MTNPQEFIKTKSSKKELPAVTQLFKDSGEAFNGKDFSDLMMDNLLSDAC